MILPLQKNLFLPGKTSHFLLGAVFFFLWGDSMGDEELCVLIWLYSQSFMGPLPPPGVIKREYCVGRTPPRSTRDINLCKAPADGGSALLQSHLKKMSSATTAAIGALCTHGLILQLPKMSYHKRFQGVLPSSTSYKTIM